MKLTLMLVLALPLLAQTERDKLNGTWQSDQGSWTIEQKSDTVHLVHSKNDQKALDLQCSSMGKECKQGKTRVSMWFSGPKLVALQTTGKEVVKRRFLAKDDNTLQVEIIPIEPAGKAETIEMKRVETTTAAAQK